VRAVTSVARMSSSPAYRDRGHAVGIGIGVVSGALMLGLVAFLCVVPSFGLFAWLYLGPDIDDAKAAAAHYLELVERGDDAGAYAMICAENQRSLTEKEFAALVEAAPRPATHEIGRAVFLDEPGREAGVSVHVTDSTGAARDIDLRLRGGKSPWLICGDTLI
jgi:hypothetical protein